MQKEDYWRRTGKQLYSQSIGVINFSNDISKANNFKYWKFTLYQLQTYFHSYREVIDLFQIAPISINPSNLYWDFFTQHPKLNEFCLFISHLPNRTTAQSVMPYIQPNTLLTAESIETVRTLLQQPIYPLFNNCRRGKCQHNSSIYSILTGPASTSTSQHPSEQARETCPNEFAFHSNIHLLVRTVDTEP